MAPLITLRSWDCPCCVYWLLPHCGTIRNSYPQKDCYSTFTCTIYVCYLKIIYTKLAPACRKGLNWKIIFFFWLTLLVAYVRRLQPTQVGPFQKALHLSDHLMSRKKTGSQKRCMQQQLNSIWSYIVIYAIFETYHIYEYTHNHIITRILYNA